MENIGERIVGDWLAVVGGCEFVSYNVHTTDTQGEIDVVGINSSANPPRLFICEVATHLVTGMLYVDPATKQSDNVARMVRKFSKNIAYARRHFPGYDYSFQLWSPVVKSAGAKARHNQMSDLEAIRAEIRTGFGLDLKIICNRDYWDRVQELRDYAARETKELKSPVLRLFQIEEKLKRHIARGKQ